MVLPTGFEVTVSVPNLETAIDAAISHGGDVLLEPAVIPGVGELVWLRDPGGNVVGAMAYAPDESAGPQTASA